jgi:HEPN domain-containing protein
MKDDDYALSAERRHEAARWLKIALDDRDVVQLCHGAYEPKLGSGAYRCQQAAEKPMKGLLVLGNCPFPKTHDLRALGVAFRTSQLELADSIATMSPWTSWGYVYRYPGPEEYDEPIPDELAQAIATVERLATIVRAALALDGSV